MFWNVLFVGIWRLGRNKTFALEMCCLNTTVTGYSGEIYWKDIRASARQQCNVLKSSIRNVGHLGYIELFSLRLVKCINKISSNMHTCILYTYVKSPWILRHTIRSLLECTTKYCRVVKFCTTHATGVNIVLQQLCAVLVPVL